MHSAASSAVLALLQHLSCIGAGKLGNVVAGDEARQGLYTAIFIQRMNLGIGALVGHIFLDEQIGIAVIIHIGNGRNYYSVFYNFLGNNYGASTEAAISIIKMYYVFIFVITQI